MAYEPEIIRTTHRRVACDGSGDIPATLGHPRVFLEIDEGGSADCGYCDRRFVLIGGDGDNAATVNMPGDIEEQGEDELGR